MREAPEHQVLATLEHGGEIRGYCAAEFSALLEGFKANFVGRDELGASLCMTHRGEVVVDIWGGFCDTERTRPWQEDTISVIFSCTKAATALCAHKLAQEGKLDFCAPVGDYWPEFASAGKEQAEVSMMFDHTVGLPGVHQKLEPGAAYNWDFMVDALAADEPFWEPGTRQGYHAVTYGWTAGEIIRRISGMSVGQYFAEHFAGPLGIDYWIGLPESEVSRVSPLHPSPEMLSGEGPVAAAAIADPESPSGQFLFNTGMTDFNEPAFLACEIPSANGVSNGRGLAHLFTPVAAAGHFKGERVFSDASIELMPRVAAATERDATLHIPTRFGRGFMLSMNNNLIRRGPLMADSVIMGPNAFGHVGMGGSVGFADPDAGLAFGYSMNWLGGSILVNERGQSLIDAAYTAIGGTLVPGGDWRVNT